MKEDLMKALEENSLREHAVQCSKNFKTSWIDLGRALYTIWKDRSFKEWGFAKFDTYTSKEIGIRKQTALKLLRSYYFLEKEEPQYLKMEEGDEDDASTIPTYESVDVLRLAKNKKALDEEDYYNLKKDVLEEGKDAREVRKALTALIREREELSPQEAWEKKKETGLKRLLSTLKSLKREMTETKMVPATLVKDVEKLIDRLEIELKH